MKKYEFTGETLKHQGKTLNRIRALKDFGDVKALDIGGWIEKEANLSHKGDCWVYDNAIVREDAAVIENAEVHNNSEIYGKALVHENAVIGGNAKIYENAEVYGKANVYECAAIHGNAKVCVNAKIYNFAEVYENAWVCGNSEVFGEPKIYGNSEIYEEAKISGNSKIYDYSKIYGSAVIRGYAEIRGYTRISNEVIIDKNALIESSRDYIFIGAIGSRNRIAEAFKTTDGIGIKVGCFYGSIEEFEARVKATHSDNEYGAEYLAFAELLKARFNIKISPAQSQNYKQGEE